MSIIFLADDFPPDVGGIQTYASELALATAQLGEEVAVVASRQEGSQEIDEALPFPVVRVPTEGSYPVAALNLNAGAQRAAERVSEPPHCLVATKWSPEGAAVILAYGRLRCLMVLLGHGGEFSHTGGNPIKWLVQRAVLRRMALCLANSHYTAELFGKAGVPSDRIGIIYGGVRPERFECDQAEAAAIRGEMGLGARPVLLTVARLVERKGHDTVLRALPRVLEEAPDTVYVAIGEGPIREALENLARELDVADSVRFVGRVGAERLPVLYRAADVFVMPSRPVRGELAEGLGLAYLEAAAAGTPGIGTHFGGIPDAVLDGETGLLVEPGDEKQLADAIVRLLTEDDPRHRLGQAARERVRAEFTWGRVAERFLAHVNALTSEGGGAAAP